MKNFTRDFKRRKSLQIKSDNGKYIYVELYKVQKQSFRSEFEKQR